MGCSFGGLTAAKISRPRRSGGPRTGYRNLRAKGYSVSKQEQSIELFE
jgi:hypothetical protein